MNEVSTIMFYKLVQINDHDYSSLYRSPVMADLPVCSEQLCFTSQKLRVHFPSAKEAVPHRSSSYPLLSYFQKVPFPDSSPNPGETHSLLLDFYVKLNFLLRCSTFWPVFCDLCQQFPESYLIRPSSCLD